MSQATAEKTTDVGLLKELLFDDESRVLDELTRRVDALSASEPARRTELEESLRSDLADIEAAIKAKLSDLGADFEASKLDTLTRFEVLFERAGTADRFRTSVAQVLDGALQIAEVERHSELSEAMAPLVIRTIKSEIRNSQDELVDALYPITGRMVKSYVASAMKDLMEQVNRRIEGNPVMLRLRSLTTGRSVAELALADTQNLEIEELLFIRRASGELLARWPERSAGRDHVLGGILTAINSFAIEALGDEGTALREIDLGEERVYLRASPIYLLAARCKGSAPDSIEQILDDEFLATIEARHRDTNEGAGDGDELSAALLTRLYERLNKRISDKQAELDGLPLGIRPVRALAWAAGVLLVGWLGWMQLEAFENRRVRAIANEMIEATPEIKGYPTRAAVGPRGRELTLIGLAPTAAARDALLQRLDRALPSVKIIDQIALVPNSAAAIEPEIARVKRDLTGLEAELAQRTVRRATERASTRVSEVVPELRRLAMSLTDPQEVRRVGDIVAGIERTGRELATIGAVVAAPVGEAANLEVLAHPAHEVSQALAAAADQVSALLQPGAEPPAKVQAKAADRVPSILESAEALALEAERLAAVTVALVQAHAAIKRLPPPPAPPAPVVIQAEPTPAAQLAEFVRRHAVFFSDGTEYRDPAATAVALEELAQLIKRTDSLVRVVGYTDERGGQPRNTTLSLERAQKVHDDLVAHDIPANRLVVVGRAERLDISPQIGPTSPNRRVQFEIGFIGEKTE